MTRKRHQKLLAAYMTRLHEWDKANGNGGMDNMGHVYRQVSKSRILNGSSYQEWWDKMKFLNHDLGVGGM